MSKKTDNINWRLTSQEKDFLNNVARKEHLTLSGLLRSKIVLPFIEGEILKNNNNKNVKN